MFRCLFFINFHKLDRCNVVFFGAMVSVFSIHSGDWFSCNFRRSYIWVHLNNLLTSPVLHFPSSCRPYRNSGTVLRGFWVQFWWWKLACSLATLQISFDHAQKFYMLFIMIADQEIARSHSYWYLIEIILSFISSIIQLVF